MTSKSKISEKLITWILLTHYRSPAKFRSNRFCATNISFGFFSWGEVDVLAITKAGYFNEFEIKISLADFKKDKDKLKWQDDSKREDVIRKFYYVAPEEIAAKILVSPDLKPEHGVISITCRENYCHGNDYGVEILREAKANNKARKARDQEIYDVARLQTFRWLNMFQKEIEKESNEVGE